MHFDLFSMCGIVSYVGQKNKAIEIVFEGLKKLEYRGYDSWGIFAPGKESFLIKKIGKISDYKKKNTWPKSNIAFGHTRWATHGGITETNAHPHFSHHKKVIIAQNGVMENYAEVQRKLLNQGYQFFTGTDTEVIANLFELYLEKGQDLRKAAKSVFDKIEGRNAVIVYEFATRRLLGFRNGSPLVLGVKGKELFLSSDVAPFIDATHQVVFLNDGEAILIEGGRYEIIDLKDLKPVSREETTLKINTKVNEKGDRNSFLEKEIWEQRFVLKDILIQEEKNLREIVSVLKKAKMVYCVGAGTAYQIASWGASILQRIAGKQAFPMIASEFTSQKDFLFSKDVLIVVSQSGETADTLEAIKIAKEKGLKIISFVNVEGSTICRQSDYVLLHKVGIEKAVASTKAATAPMLLFYLVAQKIAGNKDSKGSELAKAIRLLSHYVNQGLERKCHELAKAIYRKENMYLIGRGLSYPIAREGSIKIQELSNIHAEGIAGGELKHYAISLIEKDVPCFVIVTEDSERKHILSNAMEVKARGGLIIGFDSVQSEVFGYYFPLPDLGVLKSVFALISLQMIAYHLALFRGCDPDYCRNLAKSVTVI